MNATRIKIFLLASLVVNCFGIFCGILGLSNKKQLPIRTKVAIELPKPTFKVAMSVPVGSHFGIQAIIRAFTDTLKKSNNANYQFTYYDANNDRTLMRSQAEEMVISNPDLIYPIGALCSQMAKEITEKRKKLIPTVFGAVKGPAEIGLVASEASSENHLTGVTGVGISFEERLKVMLLVKPDIKKVLIAYCPAIHFVEKDKQEIEKILCDKGVQVIAVQVYQMNEVAQKITSFLQESDKPDVVITLHDNIVSASYDLLVKLCNSAHVALFCSHLEGVEKGCAFGIGSFEDSYGIASARLVRQILEEGKHPSQIPTTRLFEGLSKLMVNTKTMKEQNLTVDPNLLFIMKNTVLV
jgi:ABC-type uncharacterized transport system substrate-binding protein